METNHIKAGLKIIFLSVVVGLAADNARASIAYGSINNFDTVNDTGVPCHGFEIELDDLHSTDITYTYDWNHYGTPKITEDVAFASGAWHTNVHVQYAAVWINAAWSAYTAVPTNAIAPTQGHQFTNPSLNFGGEHFGVGFRAQPSLVKYNWLVDGGSHFLTLGPPVNVATPTFTYVPPVAAQPAQIQAAIVPPKAPVYNEFGDATWVKEIRTTSHTNNEVKLRNLISADTNYPDLKDWRNGEPDEVEVEWQILQIDTQASNGGANGQLVAAAQNLNHGDDVVTRRYEFYQYLGPYADPDTHEALAQTVAPDGIHGTGGYANSIVVGKFLGAQMSAVQVASPLGLIDHLPDGEINTPYASRSVVIAGDTNFTVASSGALPDGMAFDPATGQVYGTPRRNGVFAFHVQALSGSQPAIDRTFHFTIAAAGEVLPPHSSVDASASPLEGGTFAGDGVYTNGAKVAITATPAPGYQFVNWIENGAVMCATNSYEFTNSLNRSLVAVFVQMPPLTLATVSAHALVLHWPTNFTGFSLLQSSNLAATNWVKVTNAVIASGTNYQINLPATNGTRFFRLKQP